MKKKRLVWYLYPSFLLMAIIPLILVSIYISNSVRGFYLNQVSSGLQSRAYLLEHYIINGLNSNNSSALDSLVKEIGDRSNTRITITSTDGIVLADSKENPLIMDNHSDRPEIASALNRRIGKEIRYSSTLEKWMMYVSVPLYKDNTIIAVIRTAVPITSINDQLSIINSRILYIALFLIFVAAFISIGLSRRIIRPIENLREGAEHFARGELDFKLDVPETEELNDLAETLIKMVRQLDERIFTITKQGNEQKAILSSMVEGVIAVDLKQNIIIINDAAGAMIQVNPTQAKGKWIHEIVRNSDIQRFIEKTLKDRISTESEIVLVTASHEERNVQVSGTTLTGTSNASIGALFVLNDITQLKKLENIRREFVANVSHELRTPLTSIKGFVETLRDGAIHEPVEAERFLNIIFNHVNRLNAIIEDLLAISRIEKETERNEIILENTLLINVITSAASLIESKASEKKIAIKYVCDNTLILKINKLLLEQSIINLLDNAIKYSEPEQTVNIIAETTESSVQISIIDKGCGIAPEHLPRLFERFYRVDKARSRKLGGTGLGLSIVKHIVNAHGGTVSVESAINKGSTFKISLPINELFHRKGLLNQQVST